MPGRRAKRTQQINPSAHCPAAVHGEKAALSNDADNTCPDRESESMAWLVTPGLALIAVTYGLARFAYGLFLPDMRATFDLSSSILGLIGAGSYVGYCLTIVIALFYTERVGARRMALIAGAMAVTGMTVVAASPTPWILALGIVIAGSSTGLASPPMAAAVARSIDHFRQDRANTLINSGTSLGVAISGPAALLLAERWRLAWAVFALVGLAVLIWNAVMMPRDNVPHPRPGSKVNAVETATHTNVKETRLSWFYLIGSPVRQRSVPLFAAAFGIGFSSAVYWTFSRELVVQAGAIGQVGSTLFWTVIGVSGLVGGATGDVVKRFGITASLRGSLALMAASITLLACAPGVLPLAYTSAALFGSTYIILTGIILVWSIKVFHNRPATGLGAGFLLIAVGQVVGAPIAGLLAGLTQPTTAFVLFAAAALVTAFLKARS